MKKWIRRVITLFSFMMWCNLSLYAQNTAIKAGEGNIIYVDKAVNVAGDGSSWENAIPELADALKWAYDNRTSFTEEEPLKVYVAVGTYKPKYAPDAFFNTLGTPTDNRDKAFLMIDHVKLFGGFDPVNGNTDLENRILPSKDGANKVGTILSGDIDGAPDVINNTALMGGATTITGNSGNAYHVVVASSKTDAVVELDGFTITGGNANGAYSLRVNDHSFYQNRGAGIATSTPITLKNSLVNNNTANSDAGGIFSTSPVMLENSSVNNNTANVNGGGIYCISTVMLRNSSVNNNTSVQGHGGGIHAYSSFNVTLENSSVNNNIAKLNGGGISSLSPVTLENSLVNNNSADNNGGGIYCTSTVTLRSSFIYNNRAKLNGGGIYSTSSITLENSFVGNNTANLDGGGVSSSSVTLGSSSISNNRAYGNGGGISCSSSVKLLRSSAVSNNVAGGYGGGIYSYSTSPITLENSRVTYNTAAYSGGGISSLSPVTLRNSVVNYNITTGGYGAGIYSFSSIHLLNSGLIGNKGNNAIYYGGLSNSDVLEVFNSIIYANIDAEGELLQTSNLLGGNKFTSNRLLYKYSFVQGDPDLANGNLVGISDPGFVNIENGDFRLLAGSPLINAGDNSLYSGDGLNLIGDKDGFGNPRLLNDIIDIGPFELYVMLPISKVYGDPAFALDTSVPGVELVYSSLDNTIAEYDLQSKKIKIKKVGTTTITVRQAGDVADDPFSGTFELTISPKPVEVVFKKDATITKVYDGNTVGSIAVSDLVLAPDQLVGDDQVNIQLSSGQVSFNNKDVGTKTISLPLSSLSLSGADVSNYRLANTQALVFNKAEITPVVLTVRGIDVDKIYNPDVAYAGGNGVTYVGFVADESVADLSGKLIYEGDAQGAIEVGEYSILPRGLTTANYHIVYIGAVLSITKAPLPAFTFNNASFVYDGTVKGLAVTGLPAGTTPRYVGNVQTDVGEYTVTATIDGGKNYESGSQTAKLTITKAPLPAFTFNNASFVYDGTVKGLAVTGLPAGTTPSYVGNVQTDAGEYTVTATIDGGKNYESGAQTAKLSILPKQQELKFAAIVPVRLDAGTIVLEISSNSSLPIQIFSDNQLVAQVQGSRELLVRAVGQAKIRAEQAGDNNHLAAIAVEQVLEVLSDKGAKIPISVHQAVSPNGDGINDFLRIEGIDLYPENKLIIFNAKGTVIQRFTNYDNHANYFDGNKAGESVSDGTYFYVLEVKVDGKWVTEKGYFVVRR